ncbi:hypothetical protein COO60DRAFT_486392 [Scenedesmus sp. NREL 46B-D3]|nr:hypothetical protein COO60DRAFT_486392 [Scenedesmus sp. NREL 46B-D3]
MLYHHHRTAPSASHQGFANFREISHCTPPPSAACSSAHGSSASCCCCCCCSAADMRRLPDHDLLICRGRCHRIKLSIPDTSAAAPQGLQGYCQARTPEPAAATGRLLVPTASTAFKGCCCCCQCLHHQAQLLLWACPSPMLLWWLALQCTSKHKDTSIAEPAALPAAKHNRTAPSMASSTFLHTCSTCSLHCFVLLPVAAAGMH